MNQCLAPGHGRAGGNPTQIGQVTVAFMLRHARPRHDATLYLCRGAGQKPRRGCGVGAGGGWGVREAGGRQGGRRRATPRRARLLDRSR